MEDWHAMRPEGRGRHCKACDKVVRDFRGLPVPDILDEMRASQGNVCGRFDAEQVVVPQREHTWRMFSLRRLQLFLCAFLLCFGVEVWGFDDLQAQNVVSVVELLKEPGVIEYLQEDAEDSPAEFRGVVLDHVDGSPISHATVLLKENGEAVAGTVTAADGRFVMRVPPLLFEEGDYEISVSYIGNEMLSHPLENTSRGIVVYLDPSFWMQAILIQNRPGDLLDEQVGLLVHRPDDLYVHGEPLDNVEGEPRGGLVGVIQMKESLEVFNGQNGEKYYHTLDEFIMMRSSEANPTGGRW